MSKLIVPHPENRLASLPIWPWLLLFALGLRLFRLDAQSLWFDEAGTVWIAKPNYNAMLATLRVYDVHPPLWYSIVWLIEHTLGNSEWLLRLPSALLGTGAVLLLWRIALQLGFSRRVALLAGLIAAILPGTLYYSQEARMYALLLCAVLGVVWALLGRRWQWFTLAGIVVVYSHNLGLMYMAVIGLAALLLTFPKVRPLTVAALWKAWRPPVVAGAIILLAWLPWAPSLLTQLHSLRSDAIFQPLVVSGVLQPYIEMTMGLHVSLAFYLGAAIASLFVTIVAVAVSRHWLFTGDGRVIAALLFGLPLLLALISWLLTPVYLARSMIGAVYLLTLLWAWLLAYARRLERNALLAVLIPMLAVTFVANYFPRNGGHYPMREFLAPVVADWQPGDVAYYTWDWTVATDQYYIDYGLTGKRPYAVRPDSADWAGRPMDGVAIGQLLNFRQASFDALRALGYKRAWLITSVGAINDPTEPGAIADILNRYPHHLFAQQSGADTVNAVYLIDLYPEF